MCVYIYISQLCENGMASTCFHFIDTESEAQ